MRGHFFTFRRLMIFSGLLVLVVLSWWARQMTEPSVAVSEVMPGQPDYYMKGLKLRTLGEDGELRHHMSARTMVHYPDKDITHFEEPQVIIYREEKPAWVIEAHQGVIDNRAEVLNLIDAVQLSQSAEGERGALQLTTRVLNISLNDEVASTDAPVKASQEGVGRAEGVGMTLDLKNDRLKLHAQVQFTYENP